MNLQYIKENINNNSELYAVSSSVIVFYYNPYLFLCILTIFLLYNIYIADFQFDIRISNTKKNRDKNKTNLLDKMLNMDKPLSEVDLKEIDNEFKTKTD
jgi:ABC-type bacteriocin/lantibiotic exporter with double-glycine peptidase domain